MPGMSVVQGKLQYMLGCIDFVSLVYYYYYYYNYDRLTEPLLAIGD